MQTIKFKYAGSMVLIETYWNVNVQEDHVFGVIFGINRNILECKLKTGLVYITSFSPY